jgi:Holliday junction resolvase
MGKTSRDKGKRGERELAGILKSYGYDCHRGVQYHGGPESPDVVGLPGIHIEVKRVERLNIENAVDQAVSDSDGTDNLAAVFHRKNKRGWNVTMPLEDWMRLYEGRWNDGKA